MSAPIELLQQVLPADARNAGLTIRYVIETHLHADFVSGHLELAKRTGYVAQHLGWLVRQGRLEAVKRGGRWYSTLAAVERYRADVEQGEVAKGRPKGR